MKRIIFSLLFFIFSLIIYNCFLKYAFWQSVAIPDVGTFKVPQRWVITQKENLLYISNKPIEEKGSILYLFGIITSKIWYYNLSNFNIFENVLHIEPVNNSVGFSNSAIYFEEKYNIDGKIEKRYILNFYSSAKEIYLLVWDPHITKNKMIKIVKSYSMYI